MNTLISYTTDNFLVNGVKSVLFGRGVGSKPPLPARPVNAGVSPALLKAMVKQGNIFVRIAGLYGATAVIMGAYGAHVFYPRDDVPEELKQVYETANKYHFFHSLALLGVPLTNRPLAVGILLTLGMTMFCGSCYYYAVTGNPNVRIVTPYGGALMMIGWFAMLL